MENKYLKHIALCILLMCIASKGTLTVREPFQNDHYQAGDVISVSWSDSNKLSDTITITLYRDDQAVYKLASDKYINFVASVITFEGQTQYFTLESSLPYSHNYRVLVFRPDRWQLLFTILHNLYSQLVWLFIRLCEMQLYTC